MVLLILTGILATPIAMIVIATQYVAQEQETSSPVNVL